MEFHIGREKSLTYLWYLLQAKSELGSLNVLLMQRLRKQRVSNFFEYVFIMPTANKRQNYIEQKLYSSKEAISHINIWCAEKFVWVSSNRRPAKVAQRLNNSLD